MKTATPPTDRSTESLLVEAADAFTDDLNSGRKPKIEDYASKYPEIAALIRQVFPALAVLEPQLGAPTGADAAGHSALGIPNAVFETLGDFRLLRELGRGGMGIVYEAEQLSLRRKVALKVLPLAGLLDSRQLARFQNESRAAAVLTHSNIVPVYFVGEDRGVHYYAMQLIRGASLAEVIERMRSAECGVRSAECGMT